MGNCITKFKKREEIARETMAFYFERPKDFVFIAGQHVVFKLVNPPETDDEGDQRVFCLASAPYEEDLMFATRMRDTAFKRVLKSMTLGSTIEMDGPYGSFVLHGDASKPAVFLVGGIGITPVRSMLWQAKHDKLQRTFYLFYSNRTREDAAFLEELDEFGLPGYKFIPVMSDTEGYINRTKLDMHLENLSSNVYYVVGPPGFVLAMRGLLSDAEVNPDDIKTDQFAGY